MLLVIFDADNSTVDEACSFCAILLLRHFITAAIVNPEMYGMMEDLVISDNCRYNLTQVTQVETTAKCVVLLSHFNFVIMCNNGFIGRFVFETFFYTIFSANVWQAV